MPEELAQITFNPVTDNCTTNFLACGNSESCRLKVIFVPHYKKTTHCSFITSGRELKKFGSLPQARCFWKCSCGVNNHANTSLGYFVAIFTDRLLRPFALLRLITKRPFFVAILTRKPWVRLREVLLG